MSLVLECNYNDAIIKIHAGSTEQSTSYSIEVLYMDTFLACEFSIDTPGNKTLLWTHTNYETDDQGEEDMIYYYHGAAKMYPGKIIAELETGYQVIQAMVHGMTQLCIMHPEIMQHDLNTRTPSWTAGSGYNATNDRVAYLAFKRAKRRVLQSISNIEKLFPIALHRYKAGKLIARAVEDAAMNPYTELCRQRLLREYMSCKDNDAIFSTYNTRLDNRNE